MRILHVSDLHYWHVTLNPFRLAGKRFLGMGNLLVNRAWKFRRETLPALVAHARDLQPDHILITGDLTATALEEEFRSVQAALEPLGPTPSLVTMIPGNHDRYTRRARRERLFEKYFGDYAPSHDFPWLKRLGSDTAILGLDACTRARISARGTISANQLDRAQQLLDTADPIIQSPLVMCHYPFALPEGITETLGHRLEGAAHLRRFLQDKGPILYCHGHVHVPWVFSPPGLTDLLCLNPGAALKMGTDESSGGQMLEVVLNGTGVEIKRHTLRRGNWEVTDLKKLTDFFRKGRQR